MSTVLYSKALIATEDEDEGEDEDEDEGEGEGGCAHAALAGQDRPCWDVGQGGVRGGAGGEGVFGGGEGCGCEAPHRSEREGLAPITNHCQLPIQIAATRVRTERGHGVGG